MANFYKYRHTFSSGPGKWEYIDTFYNEEELAEELNKEYEWSEHYRGCDIEKIETPPEKWLMEKIERLEGNIKYSTQKLEEYRNLIISMSDENKS